MKNLKNIKNIFITDYAGYERYTLTNRVECATSDYDLFIYTDLDSNARIYGVRVSKPTKKGIWFEITALGYHINHKAFISNRYLRLEYEAE
jgi:hypothetical protein